MVYFRRSIKPPEWRGNVVHPGWPERTSSLCLLDGGRVALRPLAFADFSAWSSMRCADREQLELVEPTLVDFAQAHSWSGWCGYFSRLRSSALAGHCLPLAIELDGSLVGQITLEDVAAPSLAWVGYWVASPAQGRGVATAAVALMVDHAFGRVGLHRLQATYLPRNPASGKVLEAAGFRHEGFLRRHLNIAGCWEDHHLVGLVQDDYPTTAAQRLAQAGKVRPTF